MTDDIYLSVNSLAERFSVAPKSIWRWVSEGRFPTPVKLTPGCTRWKSSDVARWEQARARAAGGDA